jgi:hypothetical protein
MILKFQLVTQCEPFNIAQGFGIHSLAACDVVQVGHAASFMVNRVKYRAINTRASAQIILSYRGMAYTPTIATRQDLQAREDM